MAIFCKICVFGRFSCVLMLKEATQNIERVRGISRLFCWGEGVEVPLIKLLWTSLIMGGATLFYLVCLFFGGGILLQVLSPSNWCESSKLLFHLVWGGDYQKYKVVTFVKVIYKKISWEQLMEGGEGCTDYYFFFRGHINLNLYCLFFHKLWTPPLISRLLRPSH